MSSPGWFAEFCAACEESDVGPMELLLTVICICAAVAIPASLAWRAFTTVVEWYIGVRS